MSREIKFRVWNSISKKMDTNSVCYQLTLGTDGTIKAAISENVLMQYTGLKDKNGKEVYEGDIVEFVGGTCDFLIDYYSRHEKGKILAVKLLKSGFTLIPCPTDFKSETPNTCGFIGNYNFWNHARSLIVIGNIYENPELLAELSEKK